MKNIINSILIGTAVLGLSACSLHDDTELFGEPAAERLEKNVAADKTLLESAANGWELHLWTGKDYSGGGYTYFMKFANDKVTVSSDIAPANMKTTSSYDVISDQGPVLTVNTYNEVFHYLAEPSMDDDDGEQQDYEFVIMRTTNDSIYLRGKKWGNHMVMTRVAESTSWEDEINKIQQMDEGLMRTFSLVEGNDTLGGVSLGDDRILTYTDKSGYKKIPYYVSTKGITLAKPLEVNGKALQELDYDADDMSLNPDGATAQGLKLSVKLPKNYMKYSEFAGDYNMTTYWGASKLTLHLVPAGDGKTYLLKGMNANFDLTLTYDKTSGTLSLNTQHLIDMGDKQVWLCGWNAFGEGYLTWSTDAGMIVSRDTNEAGTVLKFEPNDYVGLTTDSFILVLFSGSPSNDTFVGNAKGIDALYIRPGDYRLVGPETLTKIN
ncbi:MAG: DUF4302 domain-containing protein [Prevotella sp.]|nr:DUF4302 domain-containing protein [Prevotella sp.]MDD7189072.1 DUF4302 domain-containing protein [Prevotella sp.]